MIPQSSPPLAVQARPVTSTRKFSRANDVVGAGLSVSPPPILTDVVGSWFNTSQTTGEIARLTISQRDQGLMLNIEGAGSPERIAWPETPAMPYVASLDSTDVSGFEAHCDLGFMETHLAANIKHGVLVLQSYNRFKDGSGRGAYFTREFFHQNVIHEQGLTTSAMPDDDRAAFMMAADVSSGGERTASVDLGELTGLWKNTNRATRVTRELTLTKNGDVYELNAFGAGAPRDWGKIVVTPHAGGVDAHDPAGFFGVYDFDFMQMFLAANMNKGLLIIASYNTFRDGSGRSNYFSREFFYRADG
jgi:hypothetical protein